MAGETIPDYEGPRKIDQTTQQQFQSTEPRVSPGMVPEGQGGAGDLEYLTNRFNRGIAIGRGDDWVPPIGEAPNYLTEVIGSGIEGVMAHPVKSMFSVPTIFATSAANDILRNSSKETREMVDTALGWLGPGGLARLAYLPVHVLHAHGGIIQSLLHAPQTIGNAITNIVPSGAGWIRTGGRAYIGSTMGEEQPPADTTQLRGYVNSP